MMRDEIGCKRRRVRTVLALCAIAVAATFVWIGTAFAASSGVPPKPVQGPAPLVLPKVLPATPQSAPKPASGTIAPKTIRVVQPLTAVGARDASSGTPKPAGTGSQDTASGTPVPMKTITVSTPLEATGPK